MSILLPPQGSASQATILSTQRTLLQAIASTVQKLTLEQKAAMDEATYVDVTKSGNNYTITNNGTGLGDSYSETNKDSQINLSLYNGGSFRSIGGQAFIASSANTNMLTSCKFYIKKAGAPTGSAYARLYALSGSVGTTGIGTGSPLASSAAFDVSTLTTSDALITFTFSSPYALSPNTGYVIALEYTTGGDSVNYVIMGIDSSSPTHSGNACYNQNGSWTALPDSDAIFYMYYTTTTTTGTIKSAAIVKDANIGLRYWGDIVANLVAGAAGSTIKAKVCDSAGTALHTNFVTIAAAEYARIPLERPVTLTATSGSQTVWNFTSLSNADAFINELGVLAKVLLVEITLDGTNYTVLKEGTDFNEDISNILAPKITLVSGTGVVSVTSKLRATYIVNIPLSNTTIKLQIQLNRVASGDTSPSIQPLVGDATKYIGAGQVAI